MGPLSIVITGGNPKVQRLPRTGERECAGEGCQDKMFPVAAEPNHLHRNTPLRRDLKPNVVKA